MKKSIRYRCLDIILLLRKFYVCIYLIPLQVTAAPIPWSNQPFTLVTKGMRLDNVIRELGAYNSIPVVVSPRITEMYVGSLRQVSTAYALDHLARLHKLSWYYNGQTLYVYRADETGYQLVTPSVAKAQNLLTQLGQTQEKYCRAHLLPDVNAIEIWGVPACLERFAQVAKQVDEQARHLEKNRESIEVFPLRYASASDTTYRYRQQDVILPGVVSVLREMVQSAGSISPEDGKSPVITDRALPLFATDSRQNAVIVRDRKSNMPIYQDLIKQLDIKQPLIEVSVTIIDVVEGDLDALGIDWSASAKIGGGTVSFNQATGGLDANNFSTIIANTGNFMVRLNALTQHSKAKILSRPSVVTLNNIQAVLDRNTTFYTKLTAEKVAKLESITAGSLMRVTPRLVEEGEKQRVMLTLNIEDGQQGASSQHAESLPQINNSEIATQASLLAGQSLLLGGFTRDEQTTGERSIPLLRDIPVLGSLFRSSNKTNRNIVRLFLLKAEPISQS